MKKALTLLLLIAAVLFITTCRKNADEPTGTLNKKYIGIGPSVDYVAASVAGIVLDENNNPVTGASVTAFGNATTTNLQGMFYFNNINVSSKRCLLQLTKSGFYNRSHGFIAAANNINYVKIIMLSKPAAQSMASSSGGTFTMPGGAAVTFAPNSIMKADGSSYSGNVNVIVKQLSTDATGFAYMIPGGDLAGTDSLNNNVILTTYGMINAELTDNSGAPLQLLTGTKASLTMPIASAQIANAPATIALWYFDETTSLWKQQGQATKVGSNYVGNVAHFSWWNYDGSSNFATLKGRVLALDSTVVANVPVSIDGQSFTMTDESGEYSDWVPSNTTFKVQVLASTNSLNLFSQEETISPLSNGAVFTVPDLICIPPSRVSGTIKGCEGQSLTGFVYVNNAGGKLINYQFTNNGVFDVPVVPNVSVTVYGVSNSGTGQLSATTPGLNSTSPVGSIFLCDSVNGIENTFHIAGNGFDTTIVIDSASSAAYISGQSFIIPIQSGFEAGTNLNINMKITDTIPENYTFSQSDYSQGYSALFRIPSQYIQSASYKPGAQLDVTLIEVKNKGGNVKGIFSGLLTPIDSSSTPIIITKGRFNVKRQ